MALPPEISGNIASICLTLIVAGVGYIAKQAHTISQQVGKVYRTLFGEDGDSGMHVAVAMHEARLNKHDKKFIRIEAAVGIEERREDD